MSGLDPYRRRLDALDDHITRLLGERFQVCREIAIYKSRHDIPMMQPGRVKEVRARYLARGAEAQLPDDFTRELFELVIAATCKMEDALMAELAPAALGGESAHALDGHAAHALGGGATPAASGHDAL